jgi:excinuclease UvrABC helicase subunit UvrB
MTFALKKGERIDQRQLIADLVALQYKRKADFTRGTFRVRGGVIDIFRRTMRPRWRGSVRRHRGKYPGFDPSPTTSGRPRIHQIYASSHYVTPRPTLVQAISRSKRAEAAARRITQQGRLLEAAAGQRTTFDLEMMEATAPAPASKTIRAISRDAARRAAADTVRIRSRQRAGFRRQSHVPCRRSAACSAATSAARRRSPNMAPPASAAGNRPLGSNGT